MPQVLFYCPGCAFSRQISRSEIPAKATQCRCPSCRKVFSVDEAIQPLEKDADNAQISSEDSNAVAEVLPPAEESDVANDTTTTEESDAKADSTVSRYHGLLDEAFEALNGNNELEALLLLEEAEKLNTTPKLQSALAYCRAKARNQFTGAVRLCMDAINAEPTNADHYLYLGRIYLLGNKRGSAIKAFRKGIKLGPHPLLMRELRRFELRRQPVFSSLSRDHVLNRQLGKLFTRLRLR